MSASHGSAPGPEKVEMVRSARYALALVVNVVLPVAAYRLAFGHFGQAGALTASAVPLIVWMGIDLLRYQHFDALSALALSAVVMSLLVSVLAPAHWAIATEDPLVSGFTGALFLLSLLLDRPLVFYLARSTMSREKQGNESQFDELWRTRPPIVRAIRVMTAVWGIGLIAENAIRFWLIYHADDGDRLSTYVRYGVWGGLTVWTILYRRLYIKRLRE
ncbi:Transmembrane protein [Pararobbsia alpina]|uniref:VC0807 family protein n=1 Tax=Pararobbsia alpina TaxID=621374 RepID=UPI0039A75158